MADFQQTGPFKRQRIVKDEASLKVVGHVPSSPSITELDRISTFDTSRMDEFGETMEYFACASAEPNSVMLFLDESKSEMEKEEEYTRVRCLERDMIKLCD
jgi:hypothetical protein